MDWKTLGKKLIFLPIWLMVLLVIACGALLLLVFLNGWEESFIAYGVYVVSFYTLSVVTVFCIFELPPRYRKLKKRIYDHPIGNRYMTDPEYRTKVSLNISLGINLLYIGLNLLSWYLMRSWWFIVLAVYYLTLSLMRVLLVGYARKNEISTGSRKAWRRSKTCGCILLLVNLSLSGAVLMILYQNRGFDYAGILIYVMAMYTFYSTIHAIIEIIKHRKFNSPVMATANIISLSAALVSMLNLETAMFSQFGAEMALEHQRLMIMLTGAGVSITVIALSVLLIVRATRALNSADALIDKGQCTIDN